MAAQHVILAATLLELDADAATQHAQKALAIRKRTPEDGQVPTSTLLPPRNLHLRMTARYYQA